MHARTPTLTGTHAALGPQPSAPSPQHARMHTRLHARMLAHSHTRARAPAGSSPRSRGGLGRGPLGTAPPTPATPAVPAPAARYGAAAASAAATTAGSAGALEGPGAGGPLASTFGGVGHVGGGPEGAGGARGPMWRPGVASAEVYPQAAAQVRARGLAGGQIVAETWLSSCNACQSCGVRPKT